MKKNKKTIFIILGVVLVGIIGIFLFGGNSKLDWDSLALGEHLPNPNKKGEIGSNLDDYLTVRIYDADGKYFEKYIQECIDKGFTIDSKKTVSSYEAFNKDGYELKLYKMTNEFSVHLSAPEEMSNFEWPTKGIGALLPPTKSNYGKITSDTSNTFRVQVGNITMDEYKEYVKACEDKGFTIDYYNLEKTYEAKNSDGYRLNISYKGANTIDVMIQVPKQESNDKEENKTDEKEETTNSNPSGISKDFKKAMDDYESFIDEYIAFMKKYANSNGTDTQLIKDYGNYMQKYLKMVESFEKWEDEDLNKEETKYYLEVQTRVNQKLIDASLQ